MFESTVRSGTQYHSTGIRDSEGRWLQLVRCAYLLAVSKYFGYARIRDSDAGMRNPEMTRG
jgi:hypothetical protein